MIQENRAWIIAVDMGYGHQRTAYPLKELSGNGIINANSYSGIPLKDKKIWEASRNFYEFISNFKKIPLFGSFAFSIFNKFQEILSYYPKRDLSKPNIVLKRIFSLIKKGWGRDLINKLQITNYKLQTNLPIVSTFFIPSFMAEEFNYPGEIFCVICDADIARSWVSLEPTKSRIKYFAPCSWVADRLKLYGVKEKNIYLTGYPLPKTNIGTEGMEILKEDLSHRLLNLDPQKKYRERYQPVIKSYIGKLPEESNHPLTIMFSVGGAGAQKEIAIKVVKSLSEKIKKEEVKIILSAGIKEKVKNYFLSEIKKLGIKNEIDKGIEIIFKNKIEDYFEEFNQKLRKTDILWTKPSELCFYAGLGLSLILAPSIGSQEDFNRKWVLHIGAGFNQENPNNTDQWLFDLLNGGRLAEAAMQGFIEMEQLGAFKIEKIVANMNSKNLTT